MEKSIKQQLLESASSKGYRIVRLMLATQPEEMLSENVKVAINRSDYIDLETLHSEIKENLMERFKFNSTLANKFAEVIISVL